ncbi:hypothetical protein FTX61_01890 [Nitriliruptoraceae bacterium ZYF776]|nr:hypothetical protein [Profundirhabdus halotolerans]
MTAVTVPERPITSSPRSARTPCRVATSGGCLVIAVVHVAELASHAQRAAYLGVLFVVVAAAAGVVGGALWRRVSELWLGAAALLGGTTAAAFLVSRTVSLPGVSRDLPWSAPGTTAFATGGLVLVAAVVCWKRTSSDARNAYAAEHG